MPATAAFEFGPSRLDAGAKQLLRDGVYVNLSPREFIVLHTLIANAGQVLSKDTLIKAAWQDTAVGDSSLEKIVYSLRQLLDPADPEKYIRTVVRRGYQAVADVKQVAGSAAPASLDQMLARHRAWIEGLAALESLEIAQTPGARATFERLLEADPNHVLANIGMANVCTMQFEASRTDAAPLRDALTLAFTHAERACRLRPDFPECWATIGFVLERMGRRDDALAALDKAVEFEPDNWRHLARQALGNWGEARLRAARRTLVVCPQLPMAHLLAATVYIARNAHSQAERESDAALAIVAAELHGSARLAVVALYMIKGLLCLARGAKDEAMTWFDRDLATESRGHLYARECAANVWYAKAAVYFANGDREAAIGALDETLARVPLHPKARIVHAALTRFASGLPSGAGAFPQVPNVPASAAVDVAVGLAIPLSWMGRSSDAVNGVAAALTNAPAGNAGWLLPIEPWLGVHRHPEVWAPALAILHVRAR